jgi:CheY-like chemotaxis protein
MATILIIDDEPLLLKNLATLLEFEHYDVLTTLDGRTALEILQRSPVQMILCDMLMHPMNGLDILHAVRQNPRTAHIPFVFVTGMKWNLSEDDGAGIAGYLIKPFTRSSLMETVNRHLGRYRGKLQ